MLRTYMERVRRQQASWFSALFDGMVDKRMTDNIKGLQNECWKPFDGKRTKCGVPQSPFGRLD